MKTLDPSRPIQERAQFIVNAVEGQQLGETLSLLVFAEESLFKWQRLRIARVEATEPPEHLQKVLDDAREILAHQLIADGELYRRAQNVLNAVSRTEAIDGFRFWSVQGLARDLPKLREDLDRFAKARRAQAQQWNDFQAPTPMQAVQAAADRASETATQAISAAAEAYAHVSDFLSKTTRDRSMGVSKAQVRGRRPRESASRAFVRSCKQQRSGPGPQSRWIANRQGTVLMDGNIHASIVDLVPHHLRIGRHLRGTRRAATHVACKLDH